MAYPLAKAELYRQLLYPLAGYAEDLCYLTRCLHTPNFMPFPITCQGASVLFRCDFSAVMHTEKGGPRRGLFMPKRHSLPTSLCL